MITPVILSGGVGSRLWPISREHHPKQFLNLTDAHTSMLQQTLLRLQGLSHCQAPLVVCNQDHRFLVAEQVQQLGQAARAILLEPCGRNTAPAVAQAALHLLHQGEDPLMLVLPADHVIQHTAAFVQQLEQATQAAAQGALVTLGVVPTRAHTGYGYIQRGAARADGGFAIERFVEKPPLTQAQAYVQAGDYYWNSGMFLMRASCYLEALEAHAPALLEACKIAYQGAVQDLDFLRLPQEAFAACPADSIDYAVMEHTQKGVVFPLTAGWSDVGAWDAVWEVMQEAQGLYTHGDVLTHNTQNAYVYSSSRLVATVGMQDVIVVETDDAVLVAHKDQAQEVKQIVQQLKQAQRPECETHQRVYRPWGHYQTLVHGEGFQVKQIVVNPGQSLSLQMHYHRAEHWVIVQGQRGF